MVSPPPLYPAILFAAICVEQCLLDLCVCVDTSARARAQICIFHVPIPSCVQYAFFRSVRHASYAMTPETIALALQQLRSNFPVSDESSPQAGEAGPEPTAGELAEPSLA